MRTAPWRLASSFPDAAEKGSDLVTADKGIHPVELLQAWQAWLAIRADELALREDRRPGLMDGQERAPSKICERIIPAHRGLSRYMTSKPVVFVHPHQYVCAYVWSCFYVCRLAGSCSWAIIASQRSVTSTPELPCPGFLRGADSPDGFV